MITCLPEKKSIQLDNGTCATATRTASGQTLDVVSNTGELLFSYDAAAGKTIVYIPEGDLNVISKKGRIDFTAAGGISLSSPKPIEVTSMDSIRLTAKKLESVIGTILETAKNVYRHIEALSQVKAGRTRTLVKGTSHFTAENAYHKARGNYKIKAEKIHLG